MISLANLKPAKGAIKRTKIKKWICTKKRF